MLLSSQGEFSAALEFCTGENPKLVQLRNRISRNTKFISTEPAVQPAQPVKPATQSFQPVSTPAVPAPATAGRVNPLSRRKPKSAQRAPLSQPTPFTPAPAPTQPVSTGFAPISQPAFQPPVNTQPALQPPVNTQPAFQAPVSSQPAFQPVSAPQPVQPVPSFAPAPVSTPVAPVQSVLPPAAVSQPTPTMQPQPVSQAMTSLPPTGSSGFNPGMSTGGMYGGGSMYQADISHIPKGPAPDRKQATPGWNDPKNKPEYAKSVDSSMRLKKSKKTAATPSVPAEMPVFTPAPAAQNSMGMGMGGMPPMGQPMGMGQPPMGQQMAPPNSQPMGMQLPPTSGLGQPMGSSLMQPAPMGAPTNNFQER